MINTLYNNKANLDKKITSNPYEDIASSNTIIKGSIIKKDGKNIRIQLGDNKTKEIFDVVTKNNLSVKQGEMLTIKKSEIETITKISNESLEKEKEREKKEIEELKKEDLQPTKENIDALKNLKNSEIPATKENILRFVTIKNSLTDFTQNINLNTLAMLMNKGYDIENIPLSQLDKIAKDESILQDKKVSALENKVNKPISYDEARDISTKLYSSQMGKDIQDIIISLKKNDIEITKENVDKIYDTFSKLYDLKDINNENIIKTLEVDDTNISIDLLYKVKNYITTSSVSVSSVKYTENITNNLTDEDIEKMTPDIENLLEKIGIDKKDIDIAKAILKNNSQINKENVEEIKEIREVLSQIQELMDKNVAGMLIKSGVDISSMDIKQLLKEITSIINELQNVDDLQLTDEQMDLTKNLIDAIKQINSNTILKNISVKSILYSSKVGKDLYDKLFSNQKSFFSYENKVYIKASIVLNNLENIDFNSIDYKHNNISLQYLAQKHSIFNDNSNSKLQSLEYEVKYESKTEVQNGIIKHYEYMRMNLRATHINQMITNGIDPYTSDIRQVSALIQSQTIKQSKTFEKLSHLNDYTINNISSNIVAAQSEFTLKNIKKSFDLENNTGNYIDNIKSMLNEIKEKDFKELKQISKKIENILKENHTFTKDDFRKNIEQIYKHIKEMEQIISKSQGKDKEVFNKYLNEIKENIRETYKMSSKNEMIQIPFYMNGESSNANVYAKTKKNKKGNIDPNDMSVLIDLNTKNLGKMGFYIKVDNKKLSIKISGNDESVSAIKSNLQSLDNSLNSLGYDIDFIDLISPENKAKISFVNENTRDINSKVDFFI
ncbi:hypothetical protein HMPREF1143_0949 [Peptoanaerobacter stomatis]|uniref:Flagellar hook-length control protein-like C-terminal domain-containing protein n=1 Tax=Peptoanaerobacter stomatis TaxID=796937 RepID=J6HCP0_9FIRM|nr:DUF6240 domain-containing protein [Peptoanaerobacter stomatis]EJU22865.1 hypothetical protein HMPREF1143_0949 [Peptoanaerobacter stomatis]NWO25533.1 flagellar hook-length control protein FliK [Peptostreptococcaceae bacterium oral taxon 081]